jgi:hypothetical protein
MKQDGRRAQQRHESHRAHDILDETTSAAHAHRDQEKSRHHGIRAQPN